MVVAIWRVTGESEEILSMMAIVDAIYLDLPGNQEADAGGLVFLGSLGATFQGSSSSMRLIL